MIELVDSHCHLDFAAFDHDRDAVIARARSAGITRLVLPAIAAADWPRLKTISASTDGLHPAYGLHPMWLAQHRDADLLALSTWLERERPVAVGECGMDYVVDGLDRSRQQEIFAAQLRLARDHALPLIIHARRALDAVIAAIRRTAGVRGVIHSFSGSLEQAQQLWRLDFMIGLGGPVTYPRAQRLRRLAASMPLEFLLLETDAPDQPDADHQGQRNEPARLRHVLDTIAKLRDVAPACIAKATTENAKRLFALA